MLTDALKITCKILVLLLLSGCCGWAYCEDTFFPENVNNETIKKISEIT